ncbi:PE-PPE domain-containing protein [Micromonospora sp. NPDC048169]|uniref:PE-PPE domain-containing protein n=1 Tax=Micromonospora sp. NPDC048169 TaxID=3154711 RepID=UPI0033DDB437
MTKYTALILPGTGFPEGGDGICERFLANLDERFFPQIVRYPAAGFGTGGISWAQSRTAGKQALLDATRATPYPAVWCGFSQGAGIAGDAAAEYGAGKYRDLEVVGCALIADPGRPAGGTMPSVPAASGYGIVKSRPITGITAWWAAVEGDPITSLPAGSPLRTIADTADYFSLSSPQDALRWGLDLYTRALNRNYQRWWSIEHWRTWGGAAQAARNYLPRPAGAGLHALAYVEQGLLVRLADAVNRGVR